jgi:hypothetical protein
VPEPGEHRKFAIGCFNETWTYLDAADRTPEDVERMIHAAHASLYHWLQIGKPVNFARGEWQLSRVYAVAGMGERAVHHGTRCLEICQEHGIGDFDLAFAYEALARGCVAAGDRDAAATHLEMAREAATFIAEKENRDLVESDLATILI